MIKNQHYVPQSYLRRFAVDDQIWAYDKRTGRSLQTNVKNVAAERYFYDIGLSSPRRDGSESSGSDPDPQFVEEAFQRFDDWFSKTVADVLQTAERGDRLTPAQRSMMALCVAIQLLRTKTTRKSIVALYKHRIPEAWVRMGGESQEDECPIAYREGDASLIHAELMFHMPGIEQIRGLLMNRIWILAVNESEHSFYTSDSPVVLWSQSESADAPAGLGSHDTAVMLPLAPSHALVLLERESFASMATLDARATPFSADGVTGCNAAQTCCSDRWIICRERDLELAERMCRERPEWRQPFEPDWTDKSQEPNR